MQVVGLQTWQLISSLYIARGWTESRTDNKPPRVYYSEIMLSMRGMFSTRGKSKPPLNSLFKFRPIGLNHEGTGNKICQANAEIELVFTKNRKVEG